jgi:hypothetical protein
MRKILLILVAVTLALGYSWWQWKDLVYPTLPPLPREPALRQRQFGMWITPLASAAMERRLPDDFKSAGGLEETLKQLSKLGKVKLLADWPRIEATGIRRDTPIKSQLAGKTVGDAIYGVLNEQSPPLVGIADDHMIALTITTRDVQARLGSTKSLNTADLATGVAETDALIAQIAKNVAPGSWEGRNRDDWHIANGGGLINVRANEAAYFDIAKYLNDIRLRRSRMEFARRAGIEVAIAVAIATAYLVLRHRRAQRRRRLEGCCRGCGYDLRASSDRCPECGLAFAEPVRLVV